MLVSCSRLALLTAKSLALPGFPRVLRSVQRDPNRRPLLRFSTPSGFTPEGFAVSSRRLAPLWGFLCRSAHPFRKSPHSPEASTPRVTVPHAGFRALIAVYSSSGLASLFQPAYALRLRPSGISPPKEPLEFFTRAVPSCRSSGGCAPTP